MVLGKAHDWLTAFALLVLGLALASPLRGQEPAGPERAARQAAEEGEAKAQIEEQSDASAAPLDRRAWLGDIYLRLRLPPLQPLWPMPSDDFALGGLEHSLLGLGLPGQLDDLYLTKEQIQRRRIREAAATGSSGTEELKELVSTFFSAIIAGLGGRF